MGAIVLADPGMRPDAGPRRYAVAAVLVAGWGGLFAYSAAYLTEDLPFRPVPAEAAQRADVTVGLPADDIPRRIVVLPAPEAPPPPARTAVAAVPTAPAAPVARAPAPVSPRPAVPTAPDFVGVWGPTPAACGVRSRRRGYLPATITAESARAGRTFCSFHDGRRVGNAWVTAAECSDRGRRWSSQVHLVVDGDRLTWSSSRGTAAYTRCARKAG